METAGPPTDEGVEGEDVEGAEVPHADAEAVEIPGPPPSSEKPVKPQLENTSAW